MNLNSQDRISAIVEAQWGLSNKLEKLFRFEFPRDGRSRISLACLEVAIEHHAAICKLCEARYFGSMFALLRVLFDAFVRGAYFDLCATEKEILIFNNGDGSFKTLDLIQAMEGDAKIKDQGVLSALHMNSWGVFCDFTHTGIEQVRRRHINAETGEYNYPPEEIEQVLNCAGALVLLAYAQLAKISEEQHLVDLVSAEITAYANRK